MFLCDLFFLTKDIDLASYAEGNTQNVIEIVNSGATWHSLQPPSQKNKKTHPEKFLTFFKKQCSSHFRMNANQMKDLMP